MTDGVKADEGPGGGVGAGDGAAAGLSAAEVAERVRRGEVNDVPVRSSRSLREIVRANVFTRFNAIIGVLWLVMLAVAPFQDSLFGYVIVANTAIGIFQEWRAKRTLDSLAVISEAKPTVRRDGRSREVSASELVLGDLVEIGPGDKIPVDGEVAEAESLEIDESLLTGEADPVVKRPGDQVMSGSFVVAGGGAFTATKVGREAYAARLAEEASRFTLVSSELRSGISTILKYVTWAMVPTAIGLVISQLVVKENSFKDAVARTVGGIVPMVPEGLVLLTSVAFAIGVIRLGRKQCLVQELPAIEGLARVDTVCLDKTGTLTEGGMDVSRLTPLGHCDEKRAATVLGALGASDPRPNASLQAVIDAYPDTSGWRVEQAQPFSSARKYSGASFAGQGGWLLGAPDILLPAGHPALAETEELNRQGLRVLLLAKAREGAALDAPDAAEGADPAALVVLEQRLRPDAAETLKYFEEQHVAAKVSLGGQRGRGRRRRGEAGAAGGGQRGGRARAAEGPGGAGLGDRGAHRLRARDAAAEARDGRRAPVARAHGRDDGRRRQRRPRAQGRGDRRLDGLGLGGDARGRADRAAQQQLRDAPLGRRRGPPCHRQHHAGRDALPHQDGLLGAARGPRGLLAGRVPVPAPAPDAALDAHDRGPRLLPGARAEQGTRPAPLRAPRHAVRDPLRRRRGRGDVRRVPHRPRALLGGTGRSTRRRASRR
ncbi:ATPase, P-type (transporting), HAD superfamily, subfamily IC [Streptomyces sp. SolWspMP-sol7th]|nr:ATPase, P-type (transporting), HAD superfamily, subfamily IC [Streptomyces sp. SolWspMP-sol7th]